MTFRSRFCKAILGKVRQYMVAGDVGKKTEVENRKEAFNIDKLISK